MEETQSVGDALSFIIFIKEASIFFWFNVVVSVLALANILERFYALLFRFNFDGKNFMQNVERYVLANDVTQAINYCNASKAPMAKVIKAGLLKANRGGMAVSMGMDEALLQVTPSIEKRVGTLWSFANIATLFGLIGTIAGLIRAFRGVSVAAPEQRAQLLGSGIAEALYNTAFGLTIAVTCIFAHLALSGVAKKIINDLDYYSSRLENLLSIRERSETSGSK